jgi:hypothetical protein
MGRCREEERTRWWPSLRVRDHDLRVGPDPSENAAPRRTAITTDQVGSMSDGSAPHRPPATEAADQHERRDHHRVIRDTFGKWWPGIHSNGVGDRGDAALDRDPLAGFERCDFCFQSKRGAQEFAATHLTQATHRTHGVGEVDPADHHSETFGAQRLLRPR